MPGGTGGDQNRPIKDLERSRCPAPRRGNGDARRSGDVRGDPGNEGVGEHVRTRSHSGFGPGEIAEQRFRTERRKPVSSAKPVFVRASPVEKCGPAVWPDVSPTPSFVDQSRRFEIRSEKQTVLTALVTSPASIRRQFFKRRDYFFFL